MDISGLIPKQQLVAFSEEHLYYELKMFFGVSRILMKGCDDTYIYNALLESFVLHASVILDFFYKTNAAADDALAIHYLTDTRKWRASLPAYHIHFKTFHNRRNKQVVHLSYKRMEVTQEERHWAGKRMTKQIQKIVDLFLDQADGERLHPKLHELHSSKQAG